MKIHIQILSYLLAHRPRIELGCSQMEPMLVWWCWCCLHNVVVIAMPPKGNRSFAVGGAFLSCVRSSLYWRCFVSIFWRVPAIAKIRYRQHIPPPSHHIRWSRDNEMFKSDADQSYYFKRVMIVGVCIKLLQFEEGMRIIGICVRLK